LTLNRGNGSRREGRERCRLLEGLGERYAALANRSTALMRTTVVTVAISKRRQDSPRYCFTAATSSRPEICSATLTANIAGGLKQPAALDLVLKRLAFGLGALQGGVGVAERIGQHCVREIVET
jgi:hypothetical protein